MKNFEDWFKNVNIDEFDTEYDVAKKSWGSCKNEVLKILKQDWIGLDLSINSCDKYYIEKIEKL